MSLLHPKYFLGCLLYREATVDNVREFMKEGPVLIVGMMGSGKTAVLSRIFQIERGSVEYIKMPKEAKSILPIYSFLSKKINSENMILIDNLPLVKKFINLFNRKGIVVTSWFEMPFPSIVRLEPYTNDQILEILKMRVEKIGVDVDPSILREIADISAPDSYLAVLTLYYYVKGNCSLEDCLREAIKTRLLNLSELEKRVLYFMRTKKYDIKQLGISKRWFLHIVLTLKMRGLSDGSKLTKLGELYATTI